MMRADIDSYNGIFRPKLNRRQRMAFDAFEVLNRERSYISTQLGAIPLNIKRVEIKEYWLELYTPISFEYFLLLVQSLDDVFTRHTTEKIKASHNGR